MTPSRHPTDRPDPRTEENASNTDAPLDVPTTATSTSTAPESGTTTRPSTQAVTQASVARATASQSARPRSRARGPRSAATSATAAVTPESTSARLPTARPHPDAPNADDTSSGVMATSDSVRTLTRHNTQPATAASRTASMSISQSSRPSSVSSVTDSVIPHASAPQSQYSTAGSDRLNSSFIQPPPEELLAENRDLRRRIASLENERLEILQSRSRSSRQSRSRLGSVVEGTQTSTHSVSPSQLPSLPSPSKRSSSQPLAEPPLDRANPTVRTPAPGSRRHAQNYGAAARIDEGYDRLEHLMREQDSHENDSAFRRRMGAARRERHALRVGDEADRTADHYVASWAAQQAASSEPKPRPAAGRPPAAQAQRDNPPSPDPSSSADSTHPQTHPVGAMEIPLHVCRLTLEIRWALAAALANCVRPDWPRFTLISLHHLKSHTHLRLT